MKKTLLFLFAMTLFLTGNVFAQLTGDYRSVASGDWNSVNTWETFNGTTWVTPAASIPNSITAIATIQAGHTLTMSAPAQVKTLNLNGIVTTTSTNTLTIYYTGSIVGGSTTAYIDGPLNYQITTVVNVPKTINLPLGKGSVGRPVAFKLAHNRANLITYAFEMFNAAPPSYILPATLSSVSSVRYYTIARTNITGLTSNCNLTFLYDTDDAVGTNNSLLRIVRDSGTAWLSLGGIGSAPVSGSITSVTAALLTPSLTLAAPTNNVFALGIVSVSISGNAGVAGATLSFFDGTAKTVTSAANGTYTINVPAGWSGTITPSLQYYNFTPVSLNFTSVAGNLINQNFTALSSFTDFRSVGPGSWSDPLTWEGWDVATSTWVPSSVPTGAAGSILIRDVDEVTVDVPISLEAGCTLTNEGILNVNSALTVKANALMANIGTLGNPGSSLNVYGTFEHRQDGGMIGVAGNFGSANTFFYAGSKILVTGVVNVAPSVPWGFNFPQMIWDCPNQADDAFLYINSQNNNAGKDDYSGFGNLTVLNSNSHNIFMFSGQGRSVGNIVVDGPTSKVTAFTHSSSGIEYSFFSYFSSLTVQNGGQFYANIDPGSPGKDHVTIQIHHDLIVSSNSVLGNYGYSNYSGPSFNTIGFTTNYTHILDLSGQVPAPGLDAQTNYLNFFVDGNTVTLASPIKVSSLGFNGTGKIASAGNLITVLNGGAVTGASATSFTDGPIAFEVATTTPTTLTFPVGKGTVGRPVTLNVTQDAATPTTYTAEMLNPPVPANASPLTMESVSTVRYYNITKGAGANVTNASVLLNYSTDDGVGTKNSLLRIAKDDGAGNWVDLGGTGTAPTTGTITSTSNFTTFSDFALGYAFCVNPADGGTIAETITSGCAPFDPALITGSVIPGTVEYKWQSSVAPFTTWTDIVSNTDSYNPAAITETTWYKRVVRATCTIDWVGAAESNVLVMTVNALPLVTNANTATICSGTSPAISLTASAVSAFTWVVGTITGNITGASNGSGLILDQVLTNANAVSGTVQYIITPTSVAGLCAGPNFTITVTVNPIPIVTLGAVGPFCANDAPAQLNGLPAGGTYSGTGVSASGLFTPTTAGNYVITYTFSDANGCTASATTTITVNPRPQLRATINGVIVTDNHDGVDDLGAFEVCNSTTNNLSIQLIDINGVAPSSSVKVIQEYIRTNVTFLASNGMAKISAFAAGININVKLPNASQSGTLVMRFRTFMDSNNNNILDASECSGDWIVYTIKVNAIMPPSVSVLASENPVCAGVPVTFMTTPANGGTTPTYEWFKNSLPVATSSNYSYTPVNGDQIYVIMTSNSACASVPTATSSTITMVVNSGLPASVSIAANANPVGVGTLVTFIATPINGGTAPTYQWYKGVNPVGTGATFSYIPVNGEIISVAMTTFATTCQAGSTVTSNAVTMAVNPLPTVTLAAVGPFCANDAPVQLNGLPAGGTYSGTGVSVSGLFTPATVGSQVVTYTYTDINNSTASATTTITVNPRPQLRATINGVIVTDNHDGVDDLGAFEVCNSTTNNLSIQLIDINGVAPSSSVKVIQEYIRTNVTFLASNGMAKISAFAAGININVKLPNASQSGTLVMRFRTFMDSNNNNILDASECSGDWIVYTVTVNPLPVATGIISGSATITPGSLLVPYSVVAIANASSYVWTYSGTGVTINSPVDPLFGYAVTLDFAIGAAAGTLSVNGHNACGDGTVSTLDLTVPLKSANLTGPNTISGSKENSNINLLNSEKVLNAYAISHIEIRIVGEVSNNAVATLYDILGRVVLTINLTEGSLNVVPTTNIKMGAYILSVKDASKLQQFKLVIME